MGGSTSVSSLLGRPGPLLDELGWCTSWFCLFGGWIVVSKLNVRHPGLITSPFSIGSEPTSPLPPSLVRFVRSMVAISTPRPGTIETLSELFSFSVPSRIFPSPSSTRPSVLNITWLEHPDRRVNCWEREIDECYVHDENLSHQYSAFKRYFQLVASNYLTNVVSLLCFIKGRK